MYGLKFCAVEVDEDNVRLSHFVRKIFGSFENGRAFYEFSQQECFEIPACRKVIIIPASYDPASPDYELTMISDQLSAESQHGHGVCESKINGSNLNISAVQPRTPNESLVVRVNGMQLLNSSINKQLMFNGW